MALFIPEYDGLRIHDIMLSDLVRTGTYEEAIKSNVKEGDIVIDFGTGTGILALFSVKAGAKKVYAIERENIVNLAKRIARANGLERKIEFIKSDGRNVKLPEKVDCIVSEWLGTGIFQENVLPDLAYIRDNFLKPGGIMLPQEVELSISLVGDGEIYDEYVGKWRKSFHELDYEEFARCQSHDIHIVSMSPSSFLSDPQTISKLNMRYADSSEILVDTYFEVKQKGICYGLACWFKALFPGDIILDTSPYSSSTCWQQTYLPFLEPIKVSNGEKVEVSLSTKVDELDRRVVHFIREINVPTQKTTFKYDTRKNKFMIGN